MVAQTSQAIQQDSQSIFLTEEEDRAIMEDLAQTNFDMSLDDFAKAWRAGRFDDDHQRHSDVISLAMMLPEYWNE